MNSSSLLTEIGSYYIDIGVSFKGRTTEFGSVNSGSNPLTPAISKKYKMKGLRK